MFELYNKNIKVAEISEDDCALKIVEPDLIPFELRGQRSALNFLNNRSHDANRIFSAAIEAMLGVKSIDKMIDKTALASLNDTFWLKKDSVDLSWEDVNLYDEQNNFDMRLFKAALMGLTEDDYVSYCRDESFSHVVTPELTTGGSYAKAWYRDKEHGLCLLKRGKKQYSNREVVSEYLASKVAEQLCKESAVYHLNRHGGNIYCASEIFTDENHSFIPFVNYMYASGRYQKSTESVIDYVKTVVSKFDDENKVNEMLMLDALTCNKDRHFGNFGFLYDPNTMEITSFSPVFDFNQSLGFDVPDYLVREIGTYTPQVKFKIGGDGREIIKSCSTRSLLDKVEACELKIPPSVNFDFWTEERNDMVKRMFDYQKERILTNGKFYALEREFNSDSDTPISYCDLER